MIHDLVAGISCWPEVTAVALGGSRAGGHDDPASDIDLYIYYLSEEIPLERRREFVAARANHHELDNRSFEIGDEWIDRATGIAVDMTYRTQAWLEEEMAKVLDRNEASLGYTTAFLYNVQSSKLLYDRDGWYQQLQERALLPYPRELAKAIIAKNLRVLFDTQSAFGKQILKACVRNDIVSTNHRTAAFLASYFDVLFALNLTAHPGEKRLLELAERLPLVPEDFAKDVSTLLHHASVCDEKGVRAAIDHMVPALTLCIEQAHL